jgi:3-methyladenine DNA glycosylase AlkD
MTSSEVLTELKRRAIPEKSKLLAGFFKTGKGQYGAGDIFLGVRVPEQKFVAKQFRELPLAELKKLLSNKFHEARLTALFILRHQFSKAKDEKTRAPLAKFYLANKKFVNNWDLVDSSASYILGEYLKDKPRDVLYKLVKSKTLWDRRIAIITTQAFIRNNDFKDTLALCKLLLNDPHDLMHKATGWMLREVGKKDQATLKKFLSEHAARMPRTALRYALERFDETTRHHYLSLKP